MKTVRIAGTSRNAYTPHRDSKELTRRFEKCMIEKISNQAAKVKARRKAQRLRAWNL